MKAIQSSDEDALDAARDVIQSDMEKIARTLHGVISVGDQVTVNYCTGLAGAWDQWAYEMTPLSGAQCWPATLQRQTVEDIASKAIFLMSIVMRAQLGTVTTAERVLIRQIVRPHYRPAHPLEGAPLGDARQVLRDWRVRDWDMVIPPPDSEYGYARHDYPWASLQIDHETFMQPLAAVARKIPKRPWILAISGDLTAIEADQIELDAVRLVTGNVGAWPRKLGAHSWFPGAEPNEKLFVWTMDSLRMAGIDLPPESDTFEPSVTFSISDTSELDESFGLKQARIESLPDHATIERWRQLAEDGDLTAMFNMGIIHGELLHPPDVDLARLWYERAARGGSVLAMNNLGKMFADRIFPPNVEAARHWYELAASAGLVNAMTNLGLLFVTRVEPPDEPRARQWFERAAAKEDPEALYNLGVLLSRSVPPDPSGARISYERAAAAGDYRAMANLVAIFASSVPPRRLMASYWFERAAQMHARVPPEDSRIYAHVMAAAARLMERSNDLPVR